MSKKNDNKNKARGDKKDLFLDLMSEDETRRRYAIRVLSKSATTREIADFVRGLREYQWKGKLSAIRLLAQRDDRLAVERLRALVLDFNPKVRQAAKRALKKLGVEKPFSDDDVVELVSYLDHPSWWVKVSAVKSLTALKDRRAVEPISRLLLEDDECVREAAQEALAALKRDKKK